MSPDDYIHINLLADKSLLEIPNHCLASIQYHIQMSSTKLLETASLDRILNGQTGVMKG